MSKSITTSRDAEVHRAAALQGAQKLVSHARSEHRDLTDSEQVSYDAFLATIKELDMEPILDAPAAPQTKPLTPTIRSISAAVAADNLVQRVLQAGRGRIDIPLDIRSIGSSQAVGAAPGLVLQPQNLGLISTEYGIAGRLLTALDSIPCDSNAITFSRVRYRTPVGSPSDGGGNRAAKVQELAAKPESILESEEVTQAISTYAHWISSSKQVLADATGLRSLLDTLLVMGLLDKTDLDIFAQLTTSGHYTPFTPSSGATTGEVIAEMATQLLTAGAANVKVAVNPVTRLQMQLTKASGSGQYLGLPPDIPATIVSSATIPVGKALAFSSTGCVWCSRAQISVEVGVINDQFTRNAVTILAEHRGAVLTLNAAHLLYGNAVGA